MKSIRTEIFTEKLEQNKVEHCITISRVSEDGSTPEEKKQNDLAQINNALGSSSEVVKHYRRIKPVAREPSSSETVISNHSKPKLIIVELKDRNTRNSICSKASSLRGKPQFNEIYVNADKTLSQRMAEKEARSKRNEANSKLPNTDNEERHFGN